ncbi:small-subunit processome, UTP-C complex subunit Utp22 [Schizosaccharomyces osmophilus]|uniref:U3 small nucleolar RNA-associated protein 22 n=1 Tax=Schizosaccharomyces osmophilus TaxID=2545709 RepID=A0AAF0AVQ0_9SCHI|nr:small-subunit processome, UTP-C complex subunit Utp22 [Schizosaccharomyces osmophilus]WBW72245.1 small-subunit processome, UTP-C complex subunit Utp22 [Schizosaccharomyces osmophilus]
MSASKRELSEPSNNSTEQNESIKVTNDSNDTSKNGMQSTNDSAHRKRFKPGVEREDLENLTLSKTSAFDLQAIELVREVSVSNKHSKAALSLVEKLKKVLKDVPESEESNFWQACKKLEKSGSVKVPLHKPFPAEDTNIKVKSSSPLSISPGILSCSGKHFSTPNGWVYDLLVEMPQTLFTPKDFLNNRYFHKRQYYLACLAKEIVQKVGSDVELKYIALHGDARRPILQIKPVNEDSSARRRFSIHIIPCLASFFPTSKLLAHKNCLRNLLAEEESFPTPFYNASVLEDQSMLYYRDLVKKYSVNPQFVEACGLGSVWLNMRGFCSSMHQYGFGLQEWCIMLALLMSASGLPTGSVLSAYLNATQLFKGVLQILSSDSLSNSLHKVNYDTSPLTIVDHSSPTFIDCSTALNLLYKMNQTYLDYLKASSLHSLKLLNENEIANFPKVFLTRVNVPILEYDLSGTIPVQLKANFDNYTELTDLDSKFSYYMSQLWHILQQGLNDRVNRLVLFQSEVISSGVKDSLENNYPSKVSFGILLNPEVSLRLVDIGPSLEDAESTTKFREFWGEKAELRKFKDGRIAESVYWESSTPSERSQIPMQILKYVLNRHISNQCGDMVKFHNEEFQLFSHAKLSPNVDTYNDYVPVTEAYNEAVKTLHNLSDIPLSISEVLPADEALRYSCSRVPGYDTFATTPINIVFQFESSSRWPDELEGIQRAKIAFLLKLAELMEESENVEKAAVGLENTDYPALNCCFLQVLYANGFTFRYRIRNDREAALWKTLLKNPVTKQKGQEGLYIYDHMFKFIPQHTLAIQAICQEHRSYSMAVRLAKHWFYSHLLTNHVSDEVIELLIGSVYVNSNAWQVTASGETALCRMLHFLANWDWRFEPLVIDFRQRLPINIQSQATEKLESLRKQDVSMNRNPFYIVVDYDLESKHVGWKTPTKMIANRITVLARAAVSELMKPVTDFKSLFSSSMDAYHFVIELHAAHIPTYRENAKLKYKNLKALSTERPGFSPVSAFIEEIENAFNDSIYLFYNKDDPKTIGGIFNPAIMNPRHFKININYPFKVVEEDLVVVDTAAVCQQIQQVGGDLIKSLRLQIQ